MRNEEMRMSRYLAYANALGIHTEGDAGGMPSYSTTATLRERMDQMGEQEYMISVEIGGKDEYDETV